jgi:hypothetical protein
MDTTALTAALTAIATLFPKFGPYIGALVTIITSLVTIASVIGTMLPAPTTTKGFYAWVYGVVSVLSLAKGHAASLSAPSSTGIVGGPTAISNPQVSIASLPANAPVDPIKPVVIPPAPPKP